MIKQYLIIAFRNIFRNKLFSAINILSLSGGIMFSFLIFMFARDEFNHDRFHVHQENIYRLISRATNPTGDIEFATLHDYQFVEAIQKNIPAVDKVTALKISGGWLKQGDRLFNEKIAFVDSTFFEIFSFTMLAGNPEKALQNPNSVVITREVADNFFGKPVNYNDLLGRILIFPKGEEKNFQVTGIIDDIPENSSIGFSVAVPYSHGDPYPESNNFFGNSSIYLLLNPSAQLRNIEEAANGLVENILGKKLEIALKYYFSEEDDPVYELKLQPLTDIYLNEEVWSQYEANSSLKYSYILGSIGLLVLIISCINYIMLTSGQSMQRLKEIGMRKVLGAKTRNIHTQFLTEAFLMSFLALFIGLILANFAKPVFNQLSQRNLNFNLLRTDELLFLAVLIIFISLVVGFIPGTNLNRFNPIHIFRKSIRLRSKKFSSQFFVIAQFTLSILLIAATVIILQQLNYLREKDPGIDEEQVVVISLPDDFSELKIQRLSQDLLLRSEISSVSGSDRNFIYGSSTTSMKKDNGDFMACRLLRVDPGYLETLGIELVEGRNLSYDFAADSAHSVLVNQKFIEEMGWESAIGKSLPVDEEEKPTIVGMVKNFHFDSMHDEIMPLAMHMNPEKNSIWNLFVKIHTDNTSQAVAALEKSWKNIAPDRPFEYAFLEQSLDSLYDEEERWGKIVGYAAIFTILLSSLGLFGLTLLVVSRRTKEVGIRKAIGATTSNILLLFSRDFTKWVLVAGVIATPISFYAMQQWLQSFAYKIGIEWWVFVLAGSIALLIAIVTISFHIIKAATANPVDALRYE